MPLTAEEFSQKLPSESGVYAVYDKNDDLQFIGISRNVGASVFSHLKSVPDLCSSVKVLVYCYFRYFVLGSLVVIRNYSYIHRLLRLLQKLLLKNRLFELMTLIGILE